MTSRLWRLFLLGGLTALTALPLAAQSAPPRPELPRGADPNSWEAYFDYGIAIFRNRPRQAGAAFYWATRLAPERAEPLFGQWAAFWMQDYGRWEQSLRDPERLRAHPEVQRADSLRLLAFARNPFLHRGLEAVLFERLPGEWRRDFRTRAWLAYANADFASAIELFGRSIDQNPQRNWQVRYERASAFALAGRYAEALAEMKLLLEHLQQRESTELLRSYESKALLQHGIGLLYLARRNPALAREAFNSALMEDLSFAPAHAALGELAAARGNHAEAKRAYEQALELSPADAVLHHHFARALLQAGAADAAAEHARRATELEPYYAEPYAVRGHALAKLGQAAEAEQAYTSFLQRAAVQSPQRATVEARLAALRAARAEATP